MARIATPTDTMAMAPKRRSNSAWRRDAQGSMRQVTSAPSQTTAANAEP
jgi:hypothetical protein